MIAKNNVMEWQRVACTPGSMLQNVEIRRAKGLLNLTGSSDFAIGTRSQTQKRDLQRTVAAVIMAYNEVAAEAGAPLITIHENHVKGDGKVYEDRKIPRASNERDYDYYHTLGVNYADNGRMLPHYHLEFGKALNKQNVGAVLWNLHRIGRDVLGGEILHPNDIANILNKLPEGQILPGLDAQKVGERRQLLPNELATPKDRANSRDTLESAFIALSSANTEIASKHPSLRNAHMNSFRIAEPMFEFGRIQIEFGCGLVGYRRRTGYGNGPIACSPVRARYVADHDFPLQTLHAVDAHGTVRIRHIEPVATGRRQIFLSLVLAVLSQRERVAVRARIDDVLRIVAHLTVSDVGNLDAGLRIGCGAAIRIGPCKYGVCVCVTALAVIGLSEGYSAQYA